MAYCHPELSRRRRRSRRVVCEGLEGACSRAYLCSTVKFWTGLEAVIDTYADGVTLAELSRVPEIDLGM